MVFEVVFIKFQCLFVIEFILQQRGSTAANSQRQIRISAQPHKRIRKLSNVVLRVQETGLIIS
jgi:hypothetical protein